MIPAAVEFQVPEVQSRSLRDQIVEVLQDAIISGEYQPGQRLVEREFVARFGVSSIPVREALQELETRGLVVKRHNRGCTVVNLSTDQQKKISAVRLALEPQVVAWAGANYVADEHRTPLYSAVERLMAAAEANDHAAYFRQDMHLHRLLWTMSGNEYASKALEPVVGSLFAMGLMKTKASEHVDLVEEAGKHVALIKAVTSGQPLDAAKILHDIAEGYEGILTRVDEI